MRGFGASVEWREYPDGGHWFNSPAGIDDAVAFLNKSVVGKGRSGEAVSQQAQVSRDDMDLS